MAISSRSSQFEIPFTSMLLSNSRSLGFTRGCSLDEQEISFDGMGITDLFVDWLHAEHNDHCVYRTFYVFLELSMRVFIRQLHLSHGLHYSFPDSIFEQGDWKLYISGVECEYGHGLCSI